MNAPATLDDWRPRARPARVTLEGRACRLEPLDAARHAAGLYAANALDRDGHMWAYLGYGPFDDAGQYRRWVASAERSEDPVFVAVVDAGTGAPLGVASWMRIEPAHGVIEIGHLAWSPPLQRTRAATEAVMLLLAHAFALGYRRCEWKCDARNARSRAAALRFGFTFEGVFRQHMVVKGHNRDTAWYSLLDHEWPAARAGFEGWLDPRNFDDTGRQRRSLRECRAAAGARPSPAAHGDGT